MIIDKELLQIELEKSIKYYCDLDNRELNELEIKEIAELIIKEDSKINHLFNLDPAIVVIHRENYLYDWFDFNCQLERVILWYKLNPLEKIFGASI